MTTLTIMMILFLNLMSPLALSVRRNRKITTKSISREKNTKSTMMNECKVSSR